MSDTPRIYVVRLASFNAGILRGRWIDATQGADAIWEEARKMLHMPPEPNVMVTCPNCDVKVDDTSSTLCKTCQNTGGVPSAEEWAIHDYAGFCGIRLDEWTPFAKVAECAKMLERYGGAYVAYVNSIGLEYATPAGFENSYQGHWDSAVNYAEHYLEEFEILQQVPESLRGYIDVEAFARDLELGGDMTFINAGAPDYGVYAFTNH